MIVADTNLIAYLVIPGERTAEARSVFRRDSAWAAPLLWRSEFRNVLTLYIRRGELELEQATSLIEEAQNVVQGNEFIVPSELILELAAQSDCSAYDCEFVALATELIAPLVTADRHVLRAFPEIALSPQRFLEV